MIGSFLVALLIWVVFLTLLYIGFTSLFPTEQQARNRKKRSDNVFMKVVYFIAWPLTSLIVLLGAIFLAKDITDIFKK